MLAFSVAIVLATAIRDTYCDRSHVANSVFGEHSDGDIKAFHFRGTLPRFKSEHMVNVTHDQPNLEKSFTYLRVEYTNDYSKVLVKYDMTASLVIFEVMLPFVDTPYAILGYALPKKKKQLRTVFPDWKKSYNVARSSKPENESLSNIFSSSTLV